MILLRDSLRGRSGFHIHFNSLGSRCPMKIIINECSIYLNESCFRKFSTWAVWYFLSFVEKRNSSILKKLYTRGPMKELLGNSKELPARYLQSNKNETKQSKTKKQKKKRKNKCTVKTICSLKHISSPTFFFDSWLVKGNIVPSLMKRSYFLTMTCNIPLPATPSTCIMDIRYINWSAL